MKVVASLLLCAAIMTGCYQAHSGDDLRTVPVTNNPHLIQDSHKVASFPGAPY